MGADVFLDLGEQLTVVHLPDRSAHKAPDFVAGADGLILIGNKEGRDLSVSDDLLHIHDVFRVAEIGEADPHQGDPLFGEQLPIRHQEVLRLSGGQGSVKIKDKAETAVGRKILRSLGDFRHAGISDDIAELFGDALRRTHFSVVKKEGLNHFSTCRLSS